MLPWLHTRFIDSILIVSEAIDDHIEPISDTFNLLYIIINSYTSTMII